MSSQCLATTRKVVFWHHTCLILGWSIAPKISWKSHNSHWNIDFSITTYSHFAMVKRNKMRSQCLATVSNIAFSALPKSNFGMVKRKKMTFKCHSTTWIVALSTWKKSHFQLVKKQKMISKCHSTTWIIAFSNSSKWRFGQVNWQKMSSQCLATTKKFAFSFHSSLILGWNWALQTSILRFQPTRILRWPKGLK